MQSPAKHGFFDFPTSVFGGYRLGGYWVSAVELLLDGSPRKPGAVLLLYLSRRTPRGEQKDRSSSRGTQQFCSDSRPPRPR